MSQTKKALEDIVEIINDKGRLAAVTYVIDKYDIGFSDAIEMVESAMIAYYEYWLPRTHHR